MIRKNVKKYIGIIGIIALAAFIAGAIGVTPPAQAAANDITFAVDTALIVGGQTLYVQGGGTAASYTIGASSVTFNMENGSSITVRSLGKKVMTTTPSTAYSCAATFSMASRTSTDTETFTITPGDSVCSIAGVGGAGAVASSETTTATTETTTPSPTPTSTPEPTVTTPAPTEAAPQVSAPTIQITAGTPFTKRLAVGSENSDVRQLQEMLVNDGVYSEGLITGYYGQLTKKAVQRFQEKYGIAKEGDPGYGDVGPNTRAKLNQILEGTSTTAPASSAQTGETAVKAQLEAQITALQEQLILLLAELAKQLQIQAGQ